jgi:cytidylate kinase
VGRGGQVVLADKPGVLHVRIVAPLEERVARLQAREQLTPPQARHWIAERDSASAEYLRVFFHTDVEDPTLYHLVLNTGKFSIERCVAYIGAAAESLVAASATGKAA